MSTPSAETVKRWRKANPEKVKGHSRNQYANSASHRDHVRSNSKRGQEKLRLDVIHILGDVCCQCGFSDIRALQIDHKNGGGGKHLTSTSWSIRYKQIISDPSDFQLLCANCNWIKRHEKNEVGGRPRLRDKV